MNVPSIFEVPFERSGIVSPGLPILPQGVERYSVTPAGSRAVFIYEGDEILVLNPDGMQQGELVFFDSSGRSALEKIGARCYGPATVAHKSLSDGSYAASRILKKLSHDNCDLAKAEAAQIFTKESKPSAQVRFQAECDGLLLLCVPDSIMQPEEQNPASDLILYVRRIKPKAAKQNLEAPDPLADPVLDLNIQPGMARAFEVKKGEYIQVLDVKGRECSDFQAFSLRDLDAGLEREIDPTTTRSLMGSLYPNPGNYSKYWTVDQKPLVEIIQDTCGRHDSFGLACTARYYEDLGYPGHINCSDNMNIELARYNIRQRAGWPAMNYFFNTNLDDTHQLTMDEPWSRPGDYVLLRALDDLVCISTACPCDIDEANGWEPTDIQVRKYKAREDFARGIGYRKSVEAAMEPTKKTAFHESFSKFGNDFVEYNGYWLPNSFPNIGTIDEYWACRNHGAVMDLSPLRKYEVTGPYAENLMQLCVTRNMKSLSVGQVVYTAMCFDHGGMIDDGTVYRLGERNFRWVGGNDASGLWLKEQAAKHNMEAWVRDSTDQLHNIAVQGRISRELLNSIFWTPPTQPSIEELGWFRMTIARLGDFQGTSVVISRTGYSGELGYEIFCHPNDAVTIFDAVWQAGQPLGLQPLGLGALDMLRIEGGLIFAGSEFDDQTDPFEAGIGFTVPLKSKTDDFIGRKALENRKLHPLRKLVGLQLEGQVVPSAGDCVRIGKARIGEVTSATRSPILGKVIALARVDITHCEIGEAVEVGQLDGNQKRLKATICAFPHFDPTKERVKGNYA